MCFPYAPRAFLRKLLIPFYAKNNFDFRLFERDGIILDQCAVCSFWVERPKPSQAKSLVFQISNLPYTQRFTQNWPVLQLKYFGHLLISLDRFVSLRNITRLPKFCSILCQTIFFFVIVFVPFRKIAPVLIVSFFLLKVNCTILIMLAHLKASAR